MALNPQVILVSIWQLIYISGITTPSLTNAYSDPRVREVEVKSGIRQMIECPGRSLITILLSERSDNFCGDRFYEHYANRRCSYARRCELPRVNRHLQRNCPAEESTMKIRYKCSRGQSIVRVAKISPSQPLSMFCPFDAHISLVKAYRGKKSENCHYQEAFQFIDESCRHKQNCEIDSASIPNTWKCPEAFDGSLEIDYMCRNYSEKIVSALKGEPLTIECPADHMIDIVSANYSSGTEKCFDPLAEVTVMHRCSTKNKCSFPDDVSQYFMNFCPGGKRRLEVSYTCIKVEDTKKFIVFQDGMLDLACKRGHIIQIVSAKYGNDEVDCWSITTQAKLVNECEGKTKCCASANDKSLGVSTCPKNTRKSLTVIYQCITITNLDTLENVALKEKEGEVCQNIRFELAASFGKLASDTIQTMDRDLLIMIGGSLPKLKEMSVKSFDDVIHYMQNIEFLTVNGNSYTERTDSFNDSEYGIKDIMDREDVKYQAVVWYRSLIGNRDILSEAQIDIDQLSDLVAKIGAGADSIKTSIFNREGGNQTVVDMAILRFPDYKNPFFLIYNIKLTAWWKTSRILIFEKARGGMSGQFRSVKFFPNREFIRSSKQEMIDRALAEVNSLFMMPEV